MSPRVLVVDGSLTVRMDLCEAFQAAGLEAVPCADAAAARLALDSRPFALAVIDVRLPDGGVVELLARIRSDPATRAVGNGAELEPDGSLGRAKGSVGRRRRQ